MLAFQSRGPRPQCLAVLKANTQNWYNQLEMILYNLSPTATNVGLYSSYTLSRFPMDLSSSSCLPSTKRRALSLAAFAIRALDMGDGAFVGEGAPPMDDGVATSMSLGVDATILNGET